MSQLDALKRQTIRIIVAEKNPADRDVACRVLTAEKNFLVLEASSSEELATQLDSHEVDCIIVDTTLGLQSGFEIPATVRAKHRDPPAVIMLTKAGTEQAVIKALRCGFSDYVTKESLHTRDLSSAVLRAVARRNLEKLQRSELDYMARLALRDHLTGLPNRKLLEDRLAILVASGKRHRKYFAILLIDINEFRAINDTFGHGVGDEALGAFADRLKQCARASDTFGRYGGDEFLYLIETEASQESADLACRRLAGALSFSVELDAVGLALSSTIGAAIYPVDGESTSELLQAAERAKNLAKALGNAYYLAGAPQYPRNESGIGKAVSAEGPRGASPAAARKNGVPSGAPFASPVETPEGGALARARGESGTAAMSEVRPEHGESFDLVDAYHSFPNGVHRVVDRRTQRRQRVLKRGIIVSNDGYSTINCTIRDLSENGARISVEGEYEAHIRLSLIVVETGERFAAERRWQRGKEIGLKLLLSQGASAFSPV